MKYTIFLSFLFLLSVLGACSSPADKNMLDYEHSLSRTDSLLQAGGVDSADMPRLVADLHHQYDHAKQLSGGKRVRLMPAGGLKHSLLWIFSVAMLALNVWLSIRDIKFVDDRKHRRYLVDLSKNEQRLRNNERERVDLEECLNEMSLTDEEREEVRQSLINLIAHGETLRNENESLRTRLKNYEKRALSGELTLLKEQSERARVLDDKVQTLTSVLIDRDEMVSHLRVEPKFLSDAQWNHLHQLVDKVYDEFTRTLTDRFPLLTTADMQLCLLIRLRFSNAQIATLTAVSPASVSQQKFRLKKRLLQMDDTLFKEGETVDMLIWSY